MSCQNSTYNMSFGNLANAQTEKVILPLHHHCIACEQMLHSQEFNLQKVFARVLRRVETEHQGIYLRQKMAKSKKHKFQLGGVILGQK